MREYVYTLVTRLRLPTLPFLFACTFIADTASFLLPVSNPINIIVLSTFKLDLWTFLHLLFIPALVVISINMLVFFILYRNKLRGQFDIKRLATAAEAIRHPTYFRYTCGFCCSLLSRISQPRLRNFRSQSWRWQARRSY